MCVCVLVNGLSCTSDSPQPEESTKARTVGLKYMVVQRQKSDDKAEVEAQLKQYISLRVPD